MNTDELDGLKIISDFTGFSIPTLIKWHKQEDFPMSLVGGIWISSKKAIIKWREKKIDPHSTEIMDINDRLEDIMTRIEEIERILTSKTKFKKKG